MSAALLSLLGGTQAAATPPQPPLLVPPPPPLPRSGGMRCELRSRDGATARLHGVLSEPRPGATSATEVSFTSESVPELSGTFSATWASSGGRFRRLSGDIDLSVNIELLAPTYMSGTGAVVAEIWPTGPGRWGTPRTYYAGFCDTSFSAPFGNNRP